MIKKHIVIAAVAILVTAGSGSAIAQKISAQEVALCIEAIKDLTNGKPPAEAVTLCKQGRLEAAVAKAMASQGG